MASGNNPLVIDMPVPQSSPVPEAKAAPAWLPTVMLGGLIATLIFSPLAFGTTEPWSQFIQRTAVLMLFSLWVAEQHLQGRVELNSNPIYLPALLFGLLGITQLASGATSYAYVTISELPNLAVYGILILVSGELLARRQNLRVFIASLSIFGFVLAIFAIVQGLSGTLKIYGLRSTSSVSAEIFGPYPNHNHYAGLLEMLVPLAAAAGILQSGAKRAILLFGTLIMALSIVFSRSRGGMVALAGSFLFVCFVMLRSRHRRRTAITALAVSAVFVLLVLVLGTDKVSARLLETQDQFRFRIYGDSLRMALDKPLLGYGAGTFRYVYPKFQSFWTSLLVNHAHSDYLELLVEYGIVGLALFVWMMAAVIRTGFSKLSTVQNNERRLLILAAMAGVVAMLVHSLFDFNLHIPANAALFFVLCSTVATPFKH